MLINFYHILLFTIYIVKLRSVNFILNEYWIGLETQLEAAVTWLSMNMYLANSIYCIQRPLGIRLQTVITITLFVGLSL